MTVNVGSPSNFGTMFLRLFTVYGAALQRHRRPFCIRHWQAMDGGVVAKAMFEFIGGPMYGPPATKTSQALLSTSYPSCVCLSNLRWPCSSARASPMQLNLTPRLSAAQGS